MVREKNKTEKKENKVPTAFETEAKPFLIRRLVAEGIIPPRLFLSALVVARNNSFLQKYGALILIVTGLFYIFASGILLLIFEWDNIPFLFKPTCTLFILSVCCLYTKIKGMDSLKGRVGMLLSCVFTGVLLYLSLNNPVHALPDWMIFSVWLLVISPWVLLVQREMITAFWLSAFTVALVLWGTEYAMPNELINYFEFFSLSAVCLFILLGIREFCFIRYKWSDSNLTRLLLLFYSFLSAFTPIILSAFGFGGGSFSLSTAVFLLMFGLSFGVYYSMLKDLQALTLIIYVFCAFCVTLAYMSYATYGNILPSFILIVVPFGFFSWFMFRFKQRHSTAKESEI